MFEDIKVLFYLTNDCLQVVGEKVNGTLDFPQSLVRNQEVLDEEKFIQEISKFVGEQKTGKQKSFIVLSDDLVFHKSISITDKEKAEEEYKSFINQIPFKEVSRIKYLDNNILIAVAASKSLYSSVKKGLEGLGWEITKVVPAIVFGDLIYVKDLKFEDIKQIMGSEVFKKVNFLSTDEDEELENKPEESKGEGKERKPFYWIIALIILVALVLIALYYFRSNVKQAINQSPSALSTAQPSVSTAPSEKPEVTRNSLKVKILNGSGIAGQAGKIKTDLTSLGYGSIETGNLVSNETGNSTLSVNEKVTTVMTDEIYTELKKSLNSVTKEATDSSDFDIVIITRK